MLCLKVGIPDLCSSRLASQNTTLNEQSLHMQAGLQSPTQGGSDRNVIEPIETETITQTRRRVQAAGPGP